MTIRPRRSVLYMPGANARALEKAREIPCDAIIFDLEDSVAPEAKQEARAQVMAALETGGYGRRERVVRVNGLDTPWGADDLTAARAARPDAVLIPKVSEAADLEPVQSALGPDADIAVWAMMETPRAMLNALEIADAAHAGCPALSVLVMGTNDLAKETRTELAPGRAMFLPWLAACLAAARAGGLDIIDGVYNDLDDAEGFMAECRQGRELGMDGKTLIHPRQVAPCNDAFSPSEAEIANARAIVAAFEAPEAEGKGVLRVNGRMVERLHADMARRTLALAEAL